MGLLSDPPTELGDFPSKWAILPLQILSNNLGVGEVSTEIKLFTVPCGCDCDAMFDCSCSSVDSGTSSGNSSSSASETN